MITLVSSPKQHLSKDMQHSVLQCRSVDGTINHCTEVHFASLLSSGFTTMAVLNSPERNRQITPLCIVFQVYSYSNALGAAIECKNYSGITVKLITGIYCTVYTFFHVSHICSADQASDKLFHIFWVFFQVLDQCGRPDTTATQNKTGNMK